MFNPSTQTRPTKSHIKKREGKNNKNDGMEVELAVVLESKVDIIPKSKMPVSRACPYIGKKSDSSTFYGHASSANYCHHCQAPASPLLDYQQVYCLMSRFEICPVYSRLAIEPFPMELVNIYSPASSRVTIYLSNKFHWITRLLPG